MKDKPSCAHVQLDDVRQRLFDAAGHQVSSVEQTPLLPSAWPPGEPGVEVLAYPADSLPTGTASNRIHAPSHRIKLAPLDAVPRVEQLGGGSAVLGVERRNPRWPGPPVTVTLAQSEQALLDVVAGCRALEGAANDFQAYFVWANSHPKIAADLQTRYKSFFDWLKKENPGFSLP